MKNINEISYNNEKAIMDIHKRYYVIAPNGEKVSVIYAGYGYWQTWSGRRMQWESFNRIHMKVIKEA